MMGVSLSRLLTKGKEDHSERACHRKRESCSERTIGPGTLSCKSILKQQPPRCLES